MEKRVGSFNGLSKLFTFWKRCHAQGRATILLSEPLEVISQLASMLLEIVAVCVEKV